MLAYTTRTPQRNHAINVMGSAMGAKAFTATIDMSNMLDQGRSPLFITIPAEIRTRIFEYACTSSDDLEKPYGPDRVYYRPGYRYRQKTEIALLQTCKRVFQETRVFPVGQAEHTFWMFGGPLRSLRARKHAIGNFSEWKSSLNDDQETAVNYVHLFAQQYYLEEMGTRNMISELKFKTRVFMLTLRHSDWWSWESPPESTDKLGMCPWLPDRVSHQAMLSQPLRPTIPALRATMVKGTWGWQIGQIKDLEVLRIEFETDILKMSQMETVLTSAKYWKFPLHDTTAVLESDGVVKESEWTGQAQLKQDNIPALRHVEQGSAEESAVPMRTYYVAEMVWKRRILSTGEMA